MFYDYSFKIPLNTPRYPIYTKEVYLTPGVIHRIEIGFPAGCVGMVHLQIKLGNFIIWPLNSADDFSGENYTIAFNEFYEIDTEPFILTLHGWSKGTAYPHTLRVRFGILPKKVLAPEETFIQAFKRLLQRLRL